MKYLAKATLFIAIAAAAFNAYAGPVEVDPAVPAYTQSSGVSGNLNSIGSDTLNNLMTFWAEGFKKVVSERQHPDRRQRARPPLLLL